MKEIICQVSRTTHHQVTVWVSDNAIDGDISRAACEAARKEYGPADEFELTDYEESGDTQPDDRDETLSPWQRNPSLR